LYHRFSIFAAFERKEPPLKNHPENTPSNIHTPLPSLIFTMVDEDEPYQNWLLPLALESGNVPTFVKLARQAARSSFKDAATAFRSLLPSMGCGILAPLERAGMLHSPNAVGAMLELCLSMATAHPEELLKVFPKGCGGCTYMQLAIPVALHPELDVLAAAVMGALIGDTNFRVIETGELNLMGEGLKAAYKRKQDPFPFIGNCLDFESPLYGFWSQTTISNKVGAMLQSSRLRAWMARDPDDAVATVTSYLSGPAPFNAFEDLLPNFQDEVRAATPAEPLQSIVFMRDLLSRVKEMEPSLWC